MQLLPKQVERREYFTVGFPVLLGTIIAYLPKPFFDFFPGTIASVVSNGLVMGLIFSLLSEHLLFRPKKTN